MPATSLHIVLVLGFILLAATRAPAKDDAAHVGEFDCLMEPRSVVKLGAEVSGLIRQVDVRRGDVVSEGQIVASFHSHVQEANVALAQLKTTNSHQIEAQRSRRDFLRRKLERFQELQKKDAASSAAVDEVLSEFKISESTEQEAQLYRETTRLELEREMQILEQRKVKSPISGIVIERALSAGEYRSENNHILTIAQIDPLNVEVFLPMAQWGRVKPGDLGIVVPESPVGGEYEARVVVVDRIADSGSGTFGVRLELPNPGNRLPAGVRCRVKLQNATDP